ncbi:MAG: hypothetical protein MJ082_05205, partial [Clostridia bacterium]|nr:hypothetical protein [Clostridia bacterium]
MKTLRKITSFLLAAILAMSLALCVLPLFAGAEEEEPSVIQELSYQTLSGAKITDGNTDLRLIFKVTTSEVESLGFVFSLSNDDPTVKGESCTVKTVSTLYSSIQADGEPIAAGEGTYFAAVKLTNIPHAAFDTGICIRAFVETEEGEYVYSEVKCITVCNALGHTHTVTDESVYVPATLYSDGYRGGVCDVCELDAVTKTYAKISPTREVWTSDSASTSVDKRKLSEIQNGNHFYPTVENPEGNDLLIEYSLFLNETLLNLDSSKGPYVSARIAEKGGTSSSDLVYYSLTNNVKGSWCTFAGGFEAGALGEVTSEGAAYTPAGMCAKGGSYAAYPNIGGSDQSNPEYGWHRISIRLHQEVTNLDALKAGATAATYDIVVTTYIDGVAISQLHGDLPAENRLFSA